MSAKLEINLDSIKKDGLVRTATITYESPAHNKNIEFAIPNYCIPIINSAKINMLRTKN